MRRRSNIRLVPGIATLLVCGLLLVTPVRAADVITNGTFDTNLNDWNHSDNANGSVSLDNTNFGAGAGSIQNLSNTGRNTIYTCADSQYISTSITAGDSVFLSLWWYKYSGVADAGRLDVSIEITKPDLTLATIWSETSIPVANNSLTSTVTHFDVTSFFDQSGNYSIKILGDIKNGRNASAYGQFNLDDIILDVVSTGGNAAPQVTPGATAVSVSPVNRFGANTTVISTDFTDTDQPGVGAFTATFKIREPNDVTELTLVDNQPNGGGGLTITDNGGGSYTASYTYNPDDAQTTGLYDLYFEVSDGTDNAIDDYTNNLDELEINEVLVNNAPTVVSGATAVSVSPVNRFGANTTVISTDFTDTDQPGVGAFTATFKIREPNDVTELTLVDNQPSGSGGLTITDNGGGSYTASYTYNPDDAQTLGLYDLYFEVSDGTDNAIDDYTSNLDELEINEVIANNAPTVVVGATATSVSPVNRFGANTTVISTDFTDTDQPGVGAFTATFKIREPNNSTELTLVSNQPNGSGGLTITDNGGGSYTASYTYNPDDAQTTGLYDLYFEVSDGTDNAIDDYTNNLDELEINEVIANNAPTVVSGATAVSVSPVNRFGANTTVISTDFTDADQPGSGGFTVTFKIREPNDVTELTLVDNQPNGGGGLTITDNGGGSYTASYTYNPDDAQTLGLYDLYFEVSDGTDNAIDDYTNNLDELEINEIIANNAPTVISGATQVSASPVNRFGANATVISADFTDSDQPSVGALTVTFKIREPNNSSELIQVNNQHHGSGGLNITDNGGGSYTASYAYNPDDAQTTGLYDLYFEVSDGTDNAIDDYTNNLDELEIIEILANNAPQVTPGATQVSVSPVNRLGVNTTVISTDFTDSDQPGVGAFNVIIKIREPNNSTELTLVNNQPNGSSGLVITDNGGGSYTASYTYNPDDAQTTGLYDLYFEVSDGTDNAIDDYTNNLDELEINEVIVNNPPVVAAGATIVSKTPVNRIGSDNTVISASFNDADLPGIGAFSATFKIREPNNVTELILVNNQPNGSGGLTITDLGSGTYRAEYTYNPDDAQTIGAYDLYFEVSDGSDNTIDDYANNIDELSLLSQEINFPPAMVAGTTSVAPSSMDRVGAGTVTFSANFSDANQPGIGAFYVTFQIRYPYNEGFLTIADSLQNGQGGMTVSDLGSGNYSAGFAWNPPDNITLGYYDLQGQISDGIDIGVDDFADNPDELLISNGGENIPPVVPSDNTFASPAGVERIGTNPTTISATFTDGDAASVSAFNVSFKLREPDNLDEIVLADNLSHGAGGVTITDGGGGIYTASISWDPSDVQTLGFYDLYFHVTDGIDISYDVYTFNIDELQVLNAISNNPPTLVADTTRVIPNSINRIGSEYTMITTVFTDVDVPGTGAFVVTIKVRDQSSTEYTLVNAAHHGEQDLRIRHLLGNDYEASVLWDPPVSQPTGTYDLYFYVEDNETASVTDDYTVNADELTITSEAILGDGFLLRRTNDADGCGGPSSACHNIADHQSQDCRVCHTPHSSNNIYLVRDSIQTPSSGKMEVIFKTLGIGDPFNDPDPIIGDPTSGVMADDSDHVHTGVCEVCHRTTTHHNNDDTHTIQGHYNAEICTGCHPHADGFANTGGGESSGGSGCTCHNSIFSPMNTSTTSYHHQMNGSGADYTISSKTCLMCHVDHDIFRPDLNPGFATRAKNLRADITSSVVQGDNTVLLDSDYQSSGTGGICLSCHTSTQSKGYTQPDATTQTPAMSKTDYDAATSAHNYNAPSTYSTDGSTFNANCVKCHNDNMTKSYQNSTDKFGTHNSDYRRIEAPLGVASPTDPLEEKFCYQCHSSTSNPNAGSNQDYYGVKSMTNANSLKIEQAFGYTYTHPVTTSGRHKPIESASDLADGNRHAECEDCHSPHAAQQGTHNGSSNLVSNALKGTWGVEPTSWANPPTTPTDNGNVYDTPASYTKVEPAQKEYQICLKCHSNYTTLPTGARNLGEEINPNYPSQHGIVQAGDNPFCNTNTMNEPWASSKINYCSDCHRSSVSTDPEGPHGSNMEHLLVATVTSDGTVGTPLCYVCHLEPVYWSDRNAADVSRYPDHPSAQGAHQLGNGCFSCHMWDYASTGGLGLQTTDDISAGTINVHGQNRKWVFNEQDGSAGSGDSADAFVNGYIADMDYANRACWTETCKVHSNKAY